MAGITTHVLDVTLGRPATGVPVTLERIGTDGAEVLATGSTDADGRVADLAPDGVAAGTYRLTFDTGAYFTASGQSGFYPRVAVDFDLVDPAQHHHVPLLLSPFAYSTYRGS